VLDHLCDCLCILFACAGKAWVFLDCLHCTITHSHTCILESNHANQIQLASPFKCVQIGGCLSIKILLGQDAT
jgi:hypothetical protein